jgi:hypothetical protein
MVRARCFRTVAIALLLRDQRHDELRVVVVAEIVEVLAEGAEQAGRRHHRDAPAELRDVGGKGVEIEHPGIERTRIAPPRRRVARDAWGNR